MAASTLPHVPLVYIVFFLFLEPFFALTGAVLAHFDAPSFLNTFSESAVYTPASQVIFDQLAATYVLFAFNQAVLLRVAKDLRVWKTVLLGIVLCDVLHLYASWSEIGSAVFWNPGMWRMEDWTNFGLLYGPMGLRLAFIMEVGFEKENESKFE